MRVISALLVLIFGVPGLLIYLMLRPKMTLPEQYWSELERRYLLYETAELNDCDNCGEMLQPGFVYCPNCKYEVKVKCSQCGVFIDKRWKNCPHCGDNNTAYVETTVEEKNESKKKKIRYESFGEFLSRKVNETKMKYDQKKQEKEATIVDAGKKVKEVKVKTLEKDSSKVKNNKEKKQRKNKNKNKR